MNEMNRRDDYRGDYRGDYRDDYRDDYRSGGRGNNREEDYRDDYRDSYRRGGNRRRSYRNYREEEFTEELEKYVEKAMHTYRELEDLAEMADDRNEKNTLMKIAEREKEHTRLIKEMLDKNM